MSEKIDLAKRILNAFKHFECFVFESSELKKVKEVLNDTGLNKLVVMKKADPRYDHIYILLPWNIEFEQECVSKVKELLASRRINNDYYKKNYLLLIDQCVKHHIKERVKEIINVLQRYIGGRGES
ncbi:MAG: hypothetical protein B6U89_06885 [Desulfurococcales archaeon ex4484_58]|nr:MAG: hypothetical protein B6U89_06885 [Desulfurococcales archaeon ex4484_58]